MQWLPLTRAWGVDTPPPPNRSQVCGRRQKLVLILSDVSAYDVAMAWPSVHGKDGLICADL